MTSRNSVIRVYWIKDPSNCEYSHTNNVKQRILAIQADIKAVNGQTKRPIYDRWLKFQNLFIRARTLRCIYKAAY